MSSLPNGVVTFLFTDIQGSTKLWEQYPEAMSEALNRHDAILQRIIEAHNGHVFKTVGDAFCADFEVAPDALDAALEIQRVLSHEVWGETGPLLVRMGLHTGSAQAREGDYFGPTLNRVARIQAAGHGGQILLSQATQSLVCDELADKVELRDLGQRRLKDLARPEHIFQVAVPDLPSEFPPLKTMDNRPTNLPIPTTSFVGREQETEFARVLLRRPEVRLVSLTGLAGVGKSRLSVQVATDLLEEFEDGIFFVNLSNTSDPNLIIPTIAQAVKIKDLGSQPILKVLKNYLGERQILLVLDGFEQIVVAAPIITELLAVASRLKILTTNRTLLNLYGEYEYAVPPLALPNTIDYPSTESLSQYPAVNLLLQRIQTVKPDFVLSADNAYSFNQLCTRLAGLPLAIELIAARLKDHTLPQLLTELDARLTNPRIVLTNVLNWSFEELSQSEKFFLGRLGVFVGGWTLESAAAVAGYSAEDALQSLVEKNFILQEKQPDNSFRYNMLAIVRDYALADLTDRGQLEAVCKAHAEYYLTLAEQAEPQLLGTQQDAWFERLSKELDDIRETLNWSLESEGNVEIALRLAGALRIFWQKHNHVSEGRVWLEAALTKAEGLDIPKPIRAKVLHGAGLLEDPQAGAVEARKFLTESLELYRELNDPAGVADTLFNLGMVAMFQGNYAEAITLQQESLSLFRALDNKSRIASTLNNLGYIALYQDDYRLAETFFEETLAVCRMLGNKAGLAGTLNNLACVMLYQNDYTRAIVLFKESLSQFQSLDDKRSIANVIEGLAVTAGMKDDVERGARLFGAAEWLREEVGAPQSPSDKAFYEPFLIKMRAALGEEAFAKDWADGRKMRLEQAISYANQL